MKQDTGNTEVGFIGLGLMGYPMATNLARALRSVGSSGVKADCGWIPGRADA